MDSDMRILTPRYSKEEFARRGDEIYDRDVKPHVTHEDDGKCVVIDIETGDYEMDRDELVAHHRLVAPPRCAGLVQASGLDVRAPLSLSVLFGASIREQSHVIDNNTVRTYRG